MRRLAAAAATLAPLLTAVGVATTIAPSAAIAVDTPVVISQVYGGGGNTGASFTNDFVELRNRTDAAIDISGDSIQYASATGTGNLGANSGQLVVLPGGSSVPAHGRFLVQMGGGANGAPLPTPDATGTIAMSATAGKVAYVDGADSVGCNGGSAPCSAAQEARIIDLVGYGGANYFEGAAGAAPALSNTLAAVRASDACTDTNNNADDFTAAAPAPQNHTAEGVPCGGDGGDPGDPCQAAVTHELADVQGVGAVSPLVGQTVTVEGIVTGDYQASGLFGGFFIQDPTADADPATSDGLRIFNNTAAVSPGDRVRVTGPVSEFASVASVPLFAGSETEIAGGTVTVCESGVALPDPVAIAFPFAPVTGGADGQERYEGMRVVVDDDQPLAVTENFTLGRFGEMTLSPGAPLFNPTNGGPSRAENLRNQLVLDDGRSGQNLTILPYTIGGDGVTLPRVGDTVADGEVVAGVFSYAFGLYRIEPLVPATPVDFIRTNPRTARPDPVGGDVRVASFNVLNYFVDFGGENRGANNASELARQQAKLVAAVRGLDADVVGLIEMANDDGDALSTFVAALNAAEPDASKDYAAIAAPALNPPSESLVGGTFGTDAIRVALIYRPAVVTPVGAATAINAEVMDRPAIVQAFAPVAGGDSFTAIVNHLKSKGSCPAPGADPANDDLGQGCWNARRVAQADVVIDALATAGIHDAVLLGDYNAYTDEDPIAAFEAAGYVRAVEGFVAPEDAYSYVFGGELGELDHALVSGSFADVVSGADIWHINSVEAPAYDYNDFNQPALYATDPYRSSDHDPVLLGLDLVGVAATAPAAPASVVATAGWAAASVRWTAPRTTVARRSPAMSCVRSRPAARWPRRCRWDPMS